MGKLKKKAKTPTKDEGQKKISSFFQKPSASAKSSELFTQLGHKSTSDTGHSKNTQKRSQEVIEIDDDCETDFKPPHFVSKSRQDFAQSKLARALKQSETIRKYTASNTASHNPVDSVNNEEVTIVPETQLAVTPDGKKSGESIKKNLDILKQGTFQSPASGCGDNSDLCIIPDTPDNNHNQTKAKRPLARSFLLSADHFASNPIQQAKENRAAKLALKKKASLARKSLVSVSVKFNEDAKQSVSSVTDNNKIANSHEHSPEKSVKPVTDNSTPTKVYSGGASIKRMAKLGSSPDSKRISNTVNTNCDSSDLESNDVVKSLDFTKDQPQSREIKSLDFTEDQPKTIKIKSLDFSKDQPQSTEKEHISEEIDNKQAVEEMNQRAAALLETQEKMLREKNERLERERQARVEKKRQMMKEEQKKNIDKLMKYQMTGNTAGRSDKPESVSNDEALDDILQELHSPSLIKGCKPYTSVHKKNLNTKQSGKPTASSKTVDKIPDKSKRYSLEGFIQEGKVETLSGKSKHSVANTSQNLDKVTAKNKDVNDLSVEWTEEDEKYFTQLGVKLDQTNLNSGTSSGAIKSVKSEAYVDQDDIIGKKEHKEANISTSNQTTCKTTATMNEDKTETIGKKGLSCVEIRKKSKEVGNSLSGKCETRDMFDISDYPTQSCGLQVGSGPGLHEVDIDEFTSQSDADLLSEELENHVPGQKSSQNSLPGLFQREAPCVAFSRHVVTDVHHDGSGQQITLELTSQPGETTSTCRLHGFWLDSHVEKGDIVHVLGEFVEGVCNINDKQGLLIVNPDLLISGTTVVSSVFCMRKSILKEKFKGCDSRNLQMLYGSIIHSVFQQVLRKKLLTEESILQEAQFIVKQSANLLEMYANQVTEDRVLEEVKTYLPQILSWTKQCTNIGNDILGNQRTSDSEVTITKVSDIEENIWSPRFGVKGKIDLTVEVKIKNEKKKRLLPLELKTGRPSYSVEHKGQVTLYSMMSSDRREDPGRGLLLYLKDASMKLIPADHLNKKGLIQLRNEMAYYISRQVVRSADDTGTATYTLGRLPEPISNVRACQKCPQLINCAIYQRKVEDRPPSGSPVSELVGETIQHLSTSHVTYFVQWCLMLDLEAKVDQSKKTIADIWCLNSQEREAVGLCIAGMELSDTQTEDSGDDTVILSFTRHPQYNRKKPLSSIGLNAQDSVVISCERPSWIAVCTGFIHQITNMAVHILTDRDVLDRMKQLGGRVFRLDKCDNFSTAGIIYTNLSRLITAEHTYERLRQLIIDGAKPDFSPTLSKGSLEKVKSIFKSLNKPQKAAVLKVLMCKDYVLIKGYPGTGKTSTIVALVKVLHTLGLSVLLTSYTHSAVDNILLKLKKDKLKFLRLGRVAKVHPDIREFTADRLTRNINNTADLEKFLHSQNIVATSCLGTSHALFSQRRFDVCIVDEASQVLQPACLGPLFSCARFVLVGDPKQLPPVVQSKEARELGMDESLFARLDRRGATFDLNLQYRMNKEIQAISNLLVYKGCLQCGSEAVANRTLQLPHHDSVESCVESSPWLGDVLSSSLDKSVVFLDTQKVPAPETREKGGVVKNYMEAKLVLQIVTALIQAGVEADDIGIIAPYRSQVFQLRNQLTQGQGHSQSQGRCHGDISRVEVNTVDQYQGRDKNVIIISFVRSSDEGDTKTGELLKDVRRLNVAVTRAKTKLVLVGNVATLRLYPPLEQVIQMCQDKQQITNLPAGAVH